MQDRIIGPLTMVQFIYAVVGGGICYGLFMSIPTPFSYIVVVPIALFVCAVVFLKVNERPFLEFLLSVIQFSTTPKQRVWHHQDTANLAIDVYKVRKDTGPKVQSKNISREQIAEAARRVDTKIN